MMSLVQEEGDIMRPAQHLIVAGNGRTTIACLDKLLATPSRLEITIFGAERYCAYDRAALPAYLAGQRTLDSLFLRGLDWYQERGIGVHLGTALLDIDLESRTVTAEDGFELSFDKLLLATGSVPELPAIPGLDNYGICTLETLDGARHVASLAKPGRSAVVIGETAYARELTSALTIRGCDTRRVPKAEAILGEGQVRGVLAGGETIPASFVVIAAGVHPNIQLARRMGLQIGRNGILADNDWRTSHPAILAAGSCAELRSPPLIPDAGLRHVQTAKYPGSLP